MFPTIVIINASNQNLLGAGLGKKAVETQLEDKLNQLDTLLENLTQLRSQAAFYMLKNSSFMPKLMYILRASPGFPYTELLEKFDMRIRLELENVFNCIINDETCHQVSLPTMPGGFSILSTKTLSSSAFISSFCATSSLRSGVNLLNFISSFLYNRQHFVEHRRH